MQYRSVHQLLCIIAFLIASADVFTHIRADDDFPPELTDFVPDSRNPIFTAAGEGHWDVKIRERGWILREGDQWKMWYTGYDGTRPGKKMLGYATSTDGIAWTRYPKNPVYSEHWVEDVCVIPYNGMYYMFAEGAEDRAQMLTSRDGVAWHRTGQLDVRLANGDPIPDGPYGTPTAWFEDGAWNLFYERSDRGVWLAKSVDMKVFTNVKDEPVLSPGPDDYDKDMIAMNQVIRHKNRYFAVFHGTKKSDDPKQPNLWSTGLATSTDLIHWKKYSGNPLRPVADNKSSGLLIYDGERFRLYTMHNQVDVFTHPKKADDKFKILINQLVSPNSEPIADRPYAKYPAGYDKSAQKVVKAAYLNLKQSAPDCFPVVFEHLSDKRYALTEDSGDIDKNYSVGELCRDIVISNLQPDVWGHKEGGISYRTRPRQPDYISHFGLEGSTRADEWWSTHKDKKLVELQIEVMEWVVAQATKEPGKYQQTEVDKMKAELDRLRSVQSPRPAPSMFSK